MSNGVKLELQLWGRLPAWLQPATDFIPPGAALTSFAGRKAQALCKLQSASGITFRLSDALQ